MHPQASEKRLACKEFFEALEACHENGLRKYWGGCNQYKWDLNRCLHGESTKRAAQNRVEAKARRERADKAWAALKAELE
ncbi:hypothetical protein K488DRAFT_88538 [Vararia minispora EC-137]|uniref:Uncharacterized protein n=1 Tax=Vararia minispora EC-137 TaxID=1314806 RepID=A0ACB8QEB9_9AGAM|nr:hypothetical protein K488DRAFT_88538 [Vararia minispora EC-137]